MFHQTTREKQTSQFICEVENNTTSSYTGWWLTYLSEKYESQLGLLFPIYGKTCSKSPAR